jgi:hypothetical protein
MYKYMLMHMHALLAVPHTSLTREATSQSATTTVKTAHWYGFWCSYHRLPFTCIDRLTSERIESLSAHLSESIENVRWYQKRQPTFVRILATESTKLSPELLHTTSLSCGTVNSIASMLGIDLLRHDNLDGKADLDQPGLLGYYSMGSTFEARCGHSIVSLSMVLRLSQAGVLG